MCVRIRYAFRHAPTGEQIKYKAQGRHKYTALVPVPQGSGVRDEPYITVRDHCLTRIVRQR